MDWLIRMNLVLEYIESNLKNDIDYDQIQQISCTSGDFFQRMFSHLLGIPLSEYIRRRKLSDAAVMLSSKNHSVIEVALMYGYESPDAFTYAFKKYHGISPSEVKKKNISLISYPKLSFQIKLKGSEPMKYRIIEKEAFQVMGVSIKTTQEENMNKMIIPKFWNEFNHSGKCEALNKHAIENNVLGVCYDGKPDGTFSYMIGVIASAKHQDYETIHIPKATWAIFESRGPMPHAIQKVWSDVFEIFLPTSGYEHAPMADFELYPKGDVTSQDYYCEVWIPVIRKQE